MFDKIIMQGNLILLAKYIIEWDEQYKENEESFHFEEWIYSDEQKDEMIKQLSERSIVPIVVSVDIPFNVLQYNNTIFLGTRAEAIQMINGTESYSIKVERLVREKYSLSDEIALLRQRYSKPDEFEEYNQFVEQIKINIKRMEGNL